MNKFIGVAIVLIFALNFGCSKQDTSTTTDFFSPVFVNTNIDITFPQYATLNNLQGFVYLSGGNRGIVVYHTIDDQFVAFDRTCPVNTAQTCAFVTMDSSYLYYRCGYADSTGWKACCTSKFYANNGTPASGEAKRSLKQYYTAKRGNVIYISSNPL